MKKVFITIFMFVPLMMSAQNVLTPQQQLEQAQKQLEEAKKAVENAKIAAEAAKSKDKTNKTKANSEGKSTKQDWEVPTVEKKTEAKKEEKKTLANGSVLKDDPKYLQGAVTTNSDGKIEFVLNTDANGKSAQQIYDIVYSYMTSLTQGDQNIASRVALVNKSESIIANTMDEWLVFNNTFISLDRSEFKYQLVAKIADNSLQLTMCRLVYNYEEGRSTGFKESGENVISDKVALTKKKNGLAKLFGKFRRCTIDRKDQIFNEIAALVKQ